MSESLDPIILNLLYAMLGGMLMLLGGWGASAFFRRVMGFDVKAELKDALTDYAKGFAGTPAVA